MRRLFLDPIKAMIRLLHTGSESLYLVTVDVVILGFPYLVTVLVLVILVVEPLITRMAGTATGEWKKFVELESDDNSPPRAFSIFISSIFIYTALVLLLSLDAYLVVSRDGITVNHFWGIGQSHYNWSQVKAVQRVDNGDVFRYRIIFNDGNDWISMSSGFKSYFAAKPAVEYVARNSGKRIEYVRKQ